MNNSNFKYTEIGYIPNDWEVKTLGEIAYLKSGKSINLNSESIGIYPCFGGNGIRAYINRYSHNGIYPIIGRQGELCGNVQISNGKFYATEHAVVCIPDNYIDAFWLYYQLIKADINQYKTGNAQPGLSVDKINHCVLLPLPPLPEQRRIAAALSDIDALIDKLDALIDKKRLIKQATMQQLLSGKKRINGFNDKWVMKKLGEIA